MIVVAQIATLCATRPRVRERTRNGTCWKAGPSAPVATLPSASITAIHAALDSRLVAMGVATAAPP